ncbi:MAG TPA: right-handed parallel beta-helix repeat-containing protein [Caulobacteraceae bacterium]|nr:right-handed parallel beta-helix repeat-containing protein [Caulobacteraceae bacterium]
MKAAVAIGLILAACGPHGASSASMEMNSPPSRAGPDADRSSGPIASRLERARDGDTIALPPGTYAGNLIADVNFAHGVTVTSADPDNPAVLNDLTVTHSAGITFRGLSFQVPVPAPSKTPFTVKGASERVAFVSDRFLGDPVFLHDDKGPRGLFIRGSSDISVTGSDFTQLTVGIEHDNDRDLTISDNYFHELHLRGIAGGGTNGLNITHNRFTGFFPNPKGLHPDVIFIWTTPAEEGGDRINISGNTIWRGDGAFVQGIMVSGTVSQRRGGPPITNLTIDGNKVYGMDFNGLRVAGVENLAITNNQVVGYCDRLSKIVAGGVKGAQTIKGNRAQRFNVGGFNAFPPAGNAGSGCVSPKSGEPR